MIDPATSALFTTWTHPETGLDVYLLTEKVAPSQQSFYFVNDGMSADGQYLWFYCSFPPSGSGAYGRTLGVVDVEKQAVHHFPDTQFQHASPFVDPETADVYWTTGASIWRRFPDPSAAAECVNSMPEEIVRGRQVTRVATHLSRSADGRDFFVDSALGAQHVFGTLPVDGGDFQFWHRFDRNHNHAQFSPIDPDLVLFAEEFHTDPITGLRIPIVNRMWTIRRGGSPRPIFSTPTVCSHEWWDSDGEHAWSVRRKQSWRTHIETGETETVDWPVGCWHAHCTRDGSFLVCDSAEKFYRGCPSSVHFHNRETGTFVKIVDNPGIDGIAGANYHIDPHPRFCCDDRFVVFTATLRGRIDVAVVKTADLADISQSPPG